MTQPNFKEQAMSKTAEQAWRNYCKKWVDCNPEGASLMAISDYKQALRQAIEKGYQDELHVLKNPTDYVYQDVEGARKIVNTSKKILELLDTVTPTKE